MEKSDRMMETEISKLSICARKVLPKKYLKAICVASSNAYSFRGNEKKIKFWQIFLFQQKIYCDISISIYSSKFHYRQCGTKKLICTLDGNLNDNFIPATVWRGYTFHTYFGYITNISILKIKNELNYY